MKEIISVEEHLRPAVMEPCTRSYTTEGLFRTEHFTIMWSIKSIGTKVTYIRLLQPEKATVSRHRCTPTRDPPRRRYKRLEKLGTPFRKMARPNSYNACYKSGDLHTNFTRHSNGCHRTPTGTVSSHCCEQADESPERGPTTESRPAEMAKDRVMLRGVEDDLDGTTLAMMSLSAATV